MTCSLEPSTVIEAMRILTTASQSSSEDNTSGTLFEDLLTSNIWKFDEVLRTSSAFSTLCAQWNSDSSVIISPDSSPRWKFVLYCLKTLHLLQQSLISSMKEFQKNLTPNSHTMSPDTLSFNEQKVIKGTVQFVIGLGICSNLHQGVGVPLHLRSGFSQLVSLSESAKLSHRDRSQQLYYCIKVLLSCVNCPALSTLILTQHLVDILAALFQLIHVREQLRRAQNTPSGTDAISKPDESCPDMGQNSQHEHAMSKPVGIGSCVELSTEHEHGNSEVSLQDMTPASIIDYVRLKMNGGERQSKQEDVVCTKDTQPDNVLVQELAGLTDEEYMECKEAVRDLLTRVYPPLLVKTLLLLQGTSKSKKQCSNAVGLQPAPKWLRQECGQQLTAIIMRPKGVQSVLRGMLDQPGVGQGMTASDDWRKCDAVAKVIACCPLQSLSVEEYYSKISPQIIDLLHIKDRQVSQQFLRVACSTIANMVSQQPELTSKYLISPLLSPLLRCSKCSGGHNVDMDTTGQVVVEEKELTQCVEDCHKVFVCGSADNVRLIACLQPVILVLYRLYVFIKQGVAALRTACQELLVTFLKHAEPDMTLTCLQLMTFQQDTAQNASDFPRMHQDLKFENGKEGGVVVTMETDVRESEVTAVIDETSVDCIVTIMIELKSTSVPGQHLVYMLKELTKFIQGEVSGEKQDPTALKRSAESQALLDIEHQYQSRLDQFYRKLTLLNVLAAVCEAVGPDCINSADHTLEFVKATLERGVQVCKATEDVIFEAFENETLTMAMSLLTAVMTGAFQLTSENRKKMQELLPLLQEIGSNHPESSVQEMATDIRIAIATHGAVWNEVSKSKGQKFSHRGEKIMEEKENASRLKLSQSIEVLPDKGPEQTVFVNHEAELRNCSKDSVTSTQPRIEHSKDITEVDSQTQTSRASQKAQNTRLVEDIVTKTRGDGTNNIEAVYECQGKAENQSELEQAFEELCDPLIPVRGHGLIRLTHLIQKRDSDVKQHEVVILKVLEENLDHRDSYIYLAAVNGLAALCDWNPALVLPRVCEQFAGYQSDGKGCRTGELRMKLGEVMVKASRGLGETIPKYRDVLLSSVLVGVKDEDPLVRASSLSNLGEVAKLLKFSLGNFVHEVYACCSGVLKHDSKVEVRKAAAQALTLLLQGMDDSVFKILDSVLKDLYRLLKHVMQTERDDGVKLHVHLALNELDDLMRGQLFPQQKLEKKITVLHPD